MWIGSVRNVQNKAAWHTALYLNDHIYLNDRIHLFCFSMTIGTFNVEDLEFIQYDKFNEIFYFFLLLLWYF